MTIFTLFLYVGLAASLITGIRFLFKKPNNLLVSFLQNFLGALFIFSGFVKALDPLGTSYKMKEYFEAFAHDGFSAFWEKIAHFSTEMAVIMIVAEIAIGVAMIFGWREKLTVTLLLWMNLFFLFLTGYTYLSGFCISKSFIILSAIVIVFFGLTPLIDDQVKRKNALYTSIAAFIVLLLVTKFTNISFQCAFDKTKMKVTDCGCFGDFMKLKPYMTFYKDIFLTALTLVVVYWRNKISPLLGLNIRAAVVITAAAGSLLFCLSNFMWGLPMVDFRPYAIGNDIKKQMEVIKADSIEMMFIYKNKTTKEEKTFGVKEIPTDGNWTYVDRKDNVIVEGIPAKINNLLIESDSGTNITSNLLNETENTYWIVMWNLKETNKGAWKDKIVPFVKKAKAENKRVYVLWNDHDKKFIDEMNLGIPFYFADATPLKTMIRSNPGVMEIKNGVVMNMWHWMNIPVE